MIQAGAAVQRLERGSSIGEVARALEVNPSVLRRWRRELERKIGQQALKIDFLKGCLQRIEQQWM